MTNHINDGQPTNIWHGITAAGLLRRCADATEEHARAMSLVASLMDAGEPITSEEFAAAEIALHATEAAIVAAYTGPVKLNRHGQPYGGIHPALAA